MLVATTLPDIGTWYKSSEMEEIFEVIAIDDDTDSIDIQFFSGDLEELDGESWGAINAVEIAEPEDWSGAYTMSQEDLANYANEIIFPERRISPTLEIENPINSPRE